MIDECCGGVAVSDQDKERKQQKKKGIRNEDILKLGGAYEFSTNSGSTSTLWMVL